MSLAVRVSSLLALMLAVISGAALFWVSQQVQQVERDQRWLQKNIAQEEEALRVLKAEWDYLNNPERLEALSNKYLNMAPVSADQLVQSIDAIPEPEETTTAPVEVSTGAQTKPNFQPRPMTDLPPPNLNQNETIQEDRFDQVLDPVEDEKAQ